MINNPKYKIVIFGDLPIASKVGNYLLNHEKSELVGAVIGNRTPTNNDPWDDGILLEEFCKQNSIPTYNLKEFLESFKVKELDLGLSCRFSKILKKDHIDVFKLGMVNFHGGLLPEFGGLYSSCHTILEKSPVGGGTIHFIDEGIDTGNIITRCEFPVTDHDTTSTVFRKTQLALLEGFIKIFDDLVAEKINSFDQKELVQQGYPKRYFDKHSLQGKKEFDLNDPHSTIDLKIRAFDFPGQEPAYFRIGNVKYFVRK